MEPVSRADPVGPLSLSLACHLDTVVLRELLSELAERDWAEAT